MKLGKGLRSAAAMMLSAATLLAMGALGVGTANADTTIDPTVNPYDKGTITITCPTGISCGDHKFDVAQVAKYTSATAGTGTNLTGISLETISTEKTHITDALTAIGETSYDTDNPMQTVAGWNANESSNTAPYSGKVRNFVNALAPNLTYTPSTQTGLVISDLPVGLYVLKDVTSTSAPGPGTPVSKALPILVSTTVGSYKTLNDKAIGSVELKAEDATLTKTAIKEDGSDMNAADLDKLKIGDTVTFKLASTVPNTSKYSAYTFKITDKPSKGLVYESGSAELDVNGAKDTTSGALTVGTPTNPGDDITFTVNNLNETNTTEFPYGKSLDVIYKVKLTKTGENWKQQLNNASLEYSSDPWSSATQTTAAVAVKMALYSVTLTNQNGKGGALTGGSFTVWNETGDAQLKFESDGTGRYIYSDSDGNTNEMSTDNSKLVLDGLPAGKYTIKQGNAASGYTKADFGVQIASNVAGSSTNEFSIFKEDKVNGITKTPNSISQDGTNAWNGTITVKNINSIAGLPLTGGLGIALIVLLALASGGVVVVTSKMRRKNLANARK